MPNRRNAVKELRKITKRTAHNMAVKSTLKTVRKKFEKILGEKNQENIQSAYKELASVIDKTHKKGIISTGKAARLKSRYAVKMNALSN